MNEGKHPQGKVVLVLPSRLLVYHSDDQQCGDNDGSYDSSAVRADVLNDEGGFLC